MVYPSAVSIDSFELLDRSLEEAKSRNVLSLIDVMCSIVARDDLFRLLQQRWGISRPLWIFADVVDIALPFRFSEIMFSYAQIT